MSERARAFQRVAELSVVGSHGKTRNYHPQPGGGDSSSALPASGFHSADDREFGFELKSHAHFLKRLKRCKTENDFRNVADDAEAALAAWRKAKDPPVDSKAWQEKVAKSPGSIREIAKEWQISPSYVFQIRQRFKRAA